MQFDGASSTPFDVKNGIKQGCVLTVTLFGIYFAVMLKHAFGASTEGIYLHTRSDGKLFNVSRLKAMDKICEVLIRNMLFADDAALTAHQDHLQILMDRFSKGGEDFRLTISLKKTNIISKDTESPPSLAINNYQLDVVKAFTYPGSTVTGNLDMGPGLDRRICTCQALQAGLGESQADH